jgi:hypothetical protein
VVFLSNGKGLGRGLKRVVGWNQDLGYAKTLNPRKHISTAGMASTVRVLAPTEQLQVIVDAGGIKGMTSGNTSEMPRLLSIGATPPGKDECIVNPIANYVAQSS